MSESKVKNRKGTTSIKAMSRKENMSIDTNILNTAFLARDMYASPNPAVRNTKLTNFNACYTPSSIYRFGSSTPSKIYRIKPSLNVTAKQQNNDDEEVSNLTVAIRVRPLSNLERSRPDVKSVVSLKDKELCVSMSTGESTSTVHSFEYDFVFDSSNPEEAIYASQEDVFSHTALPLVNRAFEGYNACLFAYGQTGSGKSYSMMGADSSTLDKPSSKAGIIPRVCYELFQRMDDQKSHIQAEIEISYCEIYNERIYDLLKVEENSSSDLISGTTTPTQKQRSSLKIREHPIWGPYVVGLSAYTVNSYNAIRNWLTVGNSQRATAATGLNKKSSRSHSILTIVLNLSELSESANSKSGLDEPMPNIRRSKISLVDLAGSERIWTGAGQNNCRIREGVSINKSLLTLGKVIAALSESKKGISNTSFIPYRESLLTWLLKENLGGNSKTVMLATISPANLHADETLATLRYACQARSILNRVKVNESPNDKIIRELRAEVERLRSLNAQYKYKKCLSVKQSTAGDKFKMDERDVEVLNQQLLERENELKHAQKTWDERLKEAEEKSQSEMNLLKRKGLALEISVEQKHACLVNLTADPILSGILFYVLPLGKVKIGKINKSVPGSNRPDIIIDGPLIAQNHCIIANMHGELYITPETTEFETFLNGESIHSQTQMFHGDRLVIGGSHFFRVSNPFCPRYKSNKVVDFEIAYQEVLNKQESKLRGELEEEKRIALLRIEEERHRNERNYQDQLQKLEFEQLKYACTTEILETERDSLKRYTEENYQFVMNDTMAENAVKSQSTLMEDINTILQNPSDESLHRIQLMVKEANQYCRSVGLKYQFQQTQALDEYGMFHSLIKILDRENRLKAEWPIARLSVWLDMIRDSENLNNVNIFSLVDIEWKEMDEDEIENPHSDAHNSSRISLNLSIVKDLKDGNPNCKYTTPRLSLEEQPNFTYAFNNSKVKEFAALYAFHMKFLTLRFKKLCNYDDSYKNTTSGKYVSEAVKQIENILQDLLSRLEVDKEKNDD